MIADSSVSFATEKPIIDIPQQAVVFENLNTTIEVVVNGTTTFDGNQFGLAQFHIHTPSEHRINREYFPLEVHMVHKGIGMCILANYGRLTIRAALTSRPTPYNPCLTSSPDL